jgi:hypothetical protein
MAEDVPLLPSGKDEDTEAEALESKYSQYLPSAEYYEAESANLDLLIRREKNRISRELLDELKTHEYLLTQREKAIKLKELELAQREADLDAREQRLQRLEAFELQKSPRELALEEAQEEELEFELPEETSIEKKPRDYIPNPSGQGGLPGSKLSNSIVIDRGVYQGKDLIELENGNRLRWNQNNKEYEFEFIPGDDRGMNNNRGLPFTYFAVEAAYLEDGYDNPNYPHFYSQTLLGKQVWYAKTPRNRNVGAGALGEAYEGKVPFDVLLKLVNETVNTRLFTSNGEFIQNQDFRRAYKNWRFKYEQGTYYKTKAGDLYSILTPGTQMSDSKGNPPTYRTDGNLKSPTYGQRVELSTEEKSRWKGFAKPKSNKRKK